MTARGWVGESAARSIGAAAGLAIDRFFAEPPLVVHPVARFGTAMAALEARTYRDSRRAGIVHLLIGAGVAAGLGWVAQRRCGVASATCAAVAVSVGGRMLCDEALAVADLLGADDVDAARRRIRSLVGRDTAALGVDELTRATIESVAENSVDAVTAPLWWALVGGAPAVFAHRAINTLDAMVGHHCPRYERFGWASARLDDAINWVPARLSAMAVAAVTPGRAGHVVRTVRRDAGRHPSPNGGVIEAAFAAALDVRLGGTNVYAGRAEARGALGDGRRAVVGDIERATLLAQRVWWAAAAAGLVATLPTRFNRRRAWS